MHSQGGLSFAAVALEREQAFSVCMTELFLKVFLASYARRWHGASVTETHHQ